MGRRKAPPTTDRTRLGAAQRKRLFASAWITNGQNGVEAARQAGYTGNPNSLHVRASQLLRDPTVQEILQAKVEAVEDGMDAAEILQRLTRLARMMDHAIDVFDFVTFLGPEDAPAPEDGKGNEVEGVAVSLEDAQQQVRDRGAASGHLVAPPGFAIDLPKAKRLGRGVFVRELGHDAETGAAKLKLESNLAMFELSRKALETIARCKGMFRDAPPPPPKPDLTAEEAFRMMPEEIQEAWHAAYKQALSKAKAINAQAQRIEP